MKKTYATPNLTLQAFFADVITTSGAPSYVKTNDFDASWLMAGDGN